MTDRQERQRRTRPPITLAGHDTTPRNFSGSSSTRRGRRRRGARGGRRAAPRTRRSSSAQEVPALMRKQAKWSKLLTRPLSSQIAWSTMRRAVFCTSPSKHEGAHEWGDPRLKPCLWDWLMRVACRVLRLVLGGRLAEQPPRCQVPPTIFGWQPPGRSAELPAMSISARFARAAYKAACRHTSAIS